MVSILTNQVAIMLLLILAGMLCYRLHLLTDRGVKELSGIVLQVVNPIVILLAYHRKLELRLVQNLGWTFLLSAVAMGAGIGLATLLIRNKPGRETAVERLSAVYSNCGFMGYPLMLALLGSIGVFYGSAYVVVFTFLTWTYGVFAMTGDRSQLKLRPLLLNPGVISIVLAMALFLLQITLPEIVMVPITYLSDLNTPLPMVVVGYQLSHADFRAALQGINSWISMLLRLVAFPLLSLGVCLALGLDSRLTVITVIAASAPPAALMSMFSAKFKLDTALASSMVSVQTAFSALTMPLMVSLANYLA